MFWWPERMWAQIPGLTEPFFGLFSTSSDDLKTLLQLWQPSVLQKSMISLDKTFSVISQDRVCALTCNCETVTVPIFSFLDPLSILSLSTSYFIVTLWQTFKYDPCLYSHEVTKAMLDLNTLWNLIYSLQQILSFEMKSGVFAAVPYIKAEAKKHWGELGSSQKMVFHCSLVAPMRCAWQLHEHEYLWKIVNEQRQDCFLTILRVHSCLFHMIHTVATWSACTSFWSL